MTNLPPISKLRLKQAVAWVLVVLCMVMIYGFSAQNTAQSHGASDKACEAIATVTVDGYAQMPDSGKQQVIALFDYPVRKAAHAFEYACLGASLFVALTLTKRLRGKTWTCIILAIGICFLFSVGDEVHQIFSVGRTPLFTDCLVDTFGATLGVCIAAATATCARKRRRLSDISHIDR